MSDPNPYATPETAPTLPVPEDGVPLVTATRGARFFGAFMDGLVSLAVMGPLSFVLYRSGVISSWMDTVQMTDWEWLLLTVIHFPLYIAIQWQFLKSSGQTIGKRFAGTRIVTMQGEKPSMMDLVFKREGFFTAIRLIPVVGVYLGLINILVIFRQDRRCLHDWVAGTRVVQVEPPAGEMVKRGWLD